MKDVFTRQGFIQMGVAAILGAVTGTSTFFLFLGRVKDDLRKSTDDLSKVVTQLTLQVTEGKGQYDVLNTRMTRTEQDVQKWNTDVASAVQKAVESGIEKGVTEALKTSRAGLNTPATAVVINEKTLGHD